MWTKTEVPAERDVQVYSESWLFKILDPSFNTSFGMPSGPDALPGFKLSKAFFTSFGLNFFVMWLFGKNLGISIGSLFSGLSLGEKRFWKCFWTSSRHSVCDVVRLPSCLLTAFIVELSSLGFANFQKALEEFCFFFIKFCSFLFSILLHTSRASSFLNFLKETRCPGPCFVWNLCDL